MAGSCPLARDWGVADWLQRPLEKQRGKTAPIFETCERLAHWRPSEAGELVSVPTSGTCYSCCWGPRGHSCPWQVSGSCQKQAYSLCPLDPPLLLLLKDLFSLSWQPYPCRKLSALMAAGSLSIGISKMSELGHLWLGLPPRVLALPSSVAILTPTWQTQVLLIHLPIASLSTHHCLLLPFLEGE